MISSLIYMYIAEYTNFETNCRRIFSTKKLRGGRRSPAASSAHLPAVKFSSSLPPIFSCYFMFFFSPGYHLSMLRLNPWNHEVVLKTCCQYESLIFVFVFPTSCVRLFPSLFLPLKRRPDFGHGCLGGWCWWAPLTSWSIWFLRKSQAGSTRLGSGWWSPHSAQHATCSNNTYRLVHM